MLQAAFVRSPHAHALIRGIDRGGAAAPGVHAVFTLADLAPLLSQRAAPAAVPHRAAAARHHAVRAGQGRGRLCRRSGGGGHRGQSRYLAEDAAALVAVDYEPLPAVSDCRAALAPGAPLAHRAQDQQSHASSSSRPTATSRRPLRARRIASSVSLKQHRGGAHSIEGRGALAAYDVNEDRLTLWSSTQLAHEVRAFLMTLLRLDENQVRVVAPDVGGGFGAKFVMYPEEVVVAAAGAHAAPAGQMDRGPARAFPRRGAGARPVLGPGGRLRGRWPAARRARPHDPRPRRLHAAGHQPAVQRIDRAARALHPAGL